MGTHVQSHYKLATLLIPAYLQSEVSVIHFESKLVVFSLALSDLTIGQVMWAQRYELIIARETGLVYARSGEFPDYIHRWGF